jgi:hypothetical protein
MRIRTAAFCALALFTAGATLPACDDGRCSTVAHAGGAAGTATNAGAGGAGAGAAGGATGATCPPPASTVCVLPAPSFATVITPILDRSCNTCHVENSPDGVWPLQAWADVAAWSNLIIADLVNCTMPPAQSNTPFPDGDRQLIFAWLACGSPDN